MFERTWIKILRTRPVARVTDKMLHRLIQRDFGDKAGDVKKKLGKLIYDTEKGKNRISAAIIRLSNKEINSIDHYIEMSNTDFRDVVSKAEYPRCCKLEFDDLDKRNMKCIYIDDWIEYSKWLVGGE